MLSDTIYAYLYAPLKVSSFGFQNETRTEFVSQYLRQLLYHKSEKITFFNLGPLQY